MSFLGGFEADEPRTSGFFKLRKIRTLEKDMPRKSFVIHDLSQYKKSRHISRWRHA